MSDNSALKRFYSSSSGASAADSSATTTATTPELLESRRESEHDDTDSGPNTAFNPAQVSSKLTSFAATVRAAARATTPVPGSDEGHPNDPLLRVYDPTKDDNLSIDELLARPRLPRSPFERIAMEKVKAKLEGATDGDASAELSLEEQLAAESIVEQAGVAAAKLQKADREKHMKVIRAMATDLNAGYAGRK
ncbi:hypothetical protein V493_06301 [Pseudogymnoascus sp. VKM F-4281 (FW-2241)]|nr:hypothetical protein V493_06301 [Pseudogymnoascus sp. VKM F-4281 (FW-2241)]